MSRFLKFSDRFFVKTCGDHLKNLQFIFSAQQLSLVIMNYKNLSLVVNLWYKNWHCHRLQLGKPRIFQRIHHMVSPILNSESTNFLTNIYHITCSRHRNLQNIQIRTLQIFCYDFFAWSKVGPIALESHNLF